MAEKDLIYIVSKRNNVISEFGEIQSSFNMNFVLDGTKDSALFQIVSYYDYELQPYTILSHSTTNTWWVVSQDKVERHQNDVGFYYVHNVQVLGAIELLNARDLTDCGFRSNKYTMDQFVKRLFKMSNFEYSVQVNWGYADSTTVVKYLKTFENYTLLSALREFLNGYNLYATMTFSTQIVGHTRRVYRANIYIKNKCGDSSLSDWEINDFEDINETKTIGKDSHGSIVVSNAENVVSSKKITYPTVGVAKLQSDSYTITADNCFIRLPTPVYKATKLRLVASKVGFEVVVSGSVIPIVDYFDVKSHAYDDYNVNRAFEEMVRRITPNNAELGKAIKESEEEIKQNLKKATSFDFYDGFKYDPVNDEYKKPLNAPADMKTIFVRNMNPVAQPTGYNIIFTDKTIRDGIKPSTYTSTPLGFYWERGSNKIGGFEYFGLDATFSKDIQYNFSVLGTNVLKQITINGTVYDVLAIDTYTYVAGGFDFSVNNGAINCIVEYIPMTDLKIKVYNQLEQKDIQLYNQTGKLNDGIALSKLMNSYSKEITSDNITRNITLYSYDNVPLVGTIVYGNNNEKYVISNVSIDFFQNEQTDENVSYFLQVGVTMSKEVAVKSLMVNAESNIRDYGIPQKNNVRRVQLFQDVYELDYTEDTYYERFAPLSRFTNFEAKPTKEESFITFIECFTTYPTYTSGNQEPTGTTDREFFQLNATKITLEKQVIIKTDFRDNNIIGYDSQNIASAWTPQNFFLQQRRNINTPVSYVDENGEVSDIYLIILNSEQASKIYYDYAESVGEEDKTSYFYDSVFIPQQVWNMANSLSNEEVIRRDFDDYFKDALEVPVFEYCCQVKDSDNVLIGYDFFDLQEHTFSNTFGKTDVIIYTYAYVPNGVSINEAIRYCDTTTTLPYPSLPAIHRLKNTCSIETSQEQILRTYECEELYFTPNYDYDDIVIDMGCKSAEGLFNTFEDVPHNIRLVIEFDIYDNTQLAHKTIVYTYEQIRELYNNEMAEIVNGALRIDIDDLDIREPTVDWDIPNTHTMNDTFRLEVFEPANKNIFAIELFDYGDFSVELSQGSTVSPQANKNLAIYRCVCRVQSNGQATVSPELVLIAKNIPSTAISSQDKLILYANTTKK